MLVKIHRILKGSRANGPGIRNAVWFQGCSLNCLYCFNPQTHDRAGGKAVAAATLCDELLSTPCGGITISGGEPFQQPEALLELLTHLHERHSPPILVFSGYDHEVLTADPLFLQCLSLCDALICGSFRADLQPAYERFCSSSNQELILLSDRYKHSDFADLPLSEVIIGNDGEIISSGIRCC